MNDRTPLERRGFRFGRIKARSTGEPQAPDALPPLDVVHSAVGTHAVQVLRTYPNKRPPYPFAPEGERSIARMYSKALERARAFIYVEDQYFLPLARRRDVVTQVRAIVALGDTTFGLIGMGIASLGIWRSWNLSGRGRDSQRGSSPYVRDLPLLLGALLLAVDR